MFRGNATPSRTFPGGLGCEFFDQAHVGAGHQLVDIDQDQHALVDGTQADHVFRVDRTAHVRRRLNLFRHQGGDVGDAVDDHADDAVADVEDDDDGELVIAGRAQVELCLLYTSDAADE